MERNEDVKISDQLIKELGIYGCIYGCAILIAKGLELLKKKK